MIRGTTPIHEFNTDIDLSGNDVEEIYITYRQKDKELEKTKADCTFTDSGFEIKLSQAETLDFAALGGKTEVQIRAKFADGTALASNIMSVLIGDVLKDGEI